MVLNVFSLDLWYFQPQFIIVFVNWLIVLIVSFFFFSFLIRLIKKAQIIGIICVFVDVIYLILAKDIQCFNGMPIVVKHCSTFQQLFFSRGKNLHGIREARRTRFFAGKPSDKKYEVLEKVQMVMTIIPASKMQGYQMYSSIERA